MNNIKSCLVCQYATAEEYTFINVMCNNSMALISADNVCDKFELDYRMRKVLEGGSIYSYAQNIFIASNTETKDVLVDVMDVDGNKFKDVIKVGLNPTIIKLEKVDRGYKREKKNKKVSK